MNQMRQYNLHRIDILIKDEKPDCTDQAAFCYIDCFLLREAP